MASGGSEGHGGGYQGGGADRRRGGYQGGGQERQQRGGYQGGGQERQQRGGYQGGGGQERQQRGGYQGGGQERQQRGGYHGGGGGPERQQRGGYHGGGGPERQQRGGYHGGGGPERQQRGGYHDGGGGPERQQRGGYQSGGPERQQRGGYQGGGAERQQRGGYQSGGPERQQRGGYQSGGAVSNPWGKNIRLGQHAEGSSDPVRTPWQPPQGGPHRTTGTREPQTPPRAAGGPVDMGSWKKPLPTPLQRESTSQWSTTPLSGRPDPGKSVGKIDLVANHFEMRVPRGYVYHYDVTVSTQRRIPGQETQTVPCVSAHINRLIIARMAEENPAAFPGLPVSDGRKNLYTRKQLPSPENSFNVLFRDETWEAAGRERDFNVRTQYAATLDLDALRAVYDGHSGSVPQDVIQALDIIMRHGPCLRLTPVGRSIFTPTEPGNSGAALGVGRVLWFGYYASVRPAQCKTMVNIDRSATAFYEGMSVIDFMVALLYQGHKPRTFTRLNGEQCDALSKELSMLTVQVTHLTRPLRYRVAKVTPKPASQLKFDLRGALVTVENYFQDRYGPPLLKYPQLPCIQSGAPDKLVFLPLEVCRIVAGQPCRKKLSPSMTANMIKLTAQPPDKRFEAIDESVKSMLRHSARFLEEFEITVDTQPTQLQGRVLLPPSLTYVDQEVVPENGKWNLQGMHLLDAKPIENWALLHCGSSDDLKSFKSFKATLPKVGASLGMRVSEPLDEEIGVSATQWAIFEALQRLKRKYPSLSLVIVLLAEKESYAAVKEAAEVKLGICTQCILLKNAERGTSVLSNLCLKINAKLGGTNNGFVKKLEIFDSAIVIGADVTHPAPGEKDKPSIAACVGSMDSVPAKFRASVRIQMESQQAVARVEIIAALKDMVVELLQAFKVKTRNWPKRIIYYRDGVSEGQFASVLDHELTAIQAACRQLVADGSWQPLVTFIVVQKRHHTRFKPAAGSRGVGKHNNIPPGTVVDTVVTHPVDRDFFLCSHLGIQGTSRPSRYYVVHDDSKFTAHYLQKLSYDLCHAYARCARSVSIPAPVYYAHLAAFRAKEHIASALRSVTNPTTEHYEKAVKVTEQMQDVMYFV